MKRLFLISGFILSFILPALADGPTGPVYMADHRILLLTEAGPLQLGLYPYSAPQTVKQIISLVEQHLYDRVLIPRIEPGYLFQVGDVWTTDQSRPPKLWSKVPQIPLEAKELKHKRGVLSLAHADGKPDSGQSSFSILLADAPHLDGQYTVFGQVIDSDVTLSRIVRWPTDAQHKPKNALHIMWAKYLPAAEAAEQAKALLAATPAVPRAAVSAYRAKMLAAATPAPVNGRFPIKILGSIVLLATGAFLFAKPLGQKGLLALHMLILLLGLFGMIILTEPKGLWMGGLAFLGLVAMFRLMGASESAPPPPK
jgi:cyclophilin family peptidyl-prolyl cis-trans isomerase